MKNNGFPIQLKIRLASLFLQNTTSSAVFPFMALLFTDVFNAKIAGIILIISTIIKVIFTFLGGYLTDFIKEKKIFLYWINIICSLSFLIMSILLLNLNNFYLLLFISMYFINDIAYSLSIPLSNSITLDFVNEEHRKKYSTVKYWLINVSIAIGMILGSLLYNYKFILFLLLAFSLFLNSIIILLFFKNNYNVTQKTETERNFLRNYAVVFKDYNFLLIIISYSFILTGELSMSSYSSVRLKDSFDSIIIFHQQIDGVFMFALLSFINTIFIVFFSILITKVFAQKPLYYSLLISMIFYCLGYWIISYSNNFFILVSSIILATIGEIIYSPVFESEKIKIIPVDKRGVYLAIDSLSIPLAELVVRIYLVLSAFLATQILSSIILLIMIIGFILLAISIFMSRNRNELV